METERRSAYDVVQMFWRTTEAFDTVRGHMPPDGVFLFKGHAYFVTQSIVLIVETQEQDLHLFARPHFKDVNGNLDADGEEKIWVTTVRNHPYRNLGPRPNNYYRLFPGKGATMNEIRSLIRTDGFDAVIDRSLIREYLSRTAGMRGNGEAGYVEVSTGDHLRFRFIRTPRFQAPYPVDTDIQFPICQMPRVSVGISAAALRYILRFFDTNIKVYIDDGKIYFADPLNGVTAILATRSK